MFQIPGVLGPSTCSKHLERQARKISQVSLHAAWSLLSVGEL